MGNNEIVFVYTNIVVGGIQTLLFRLARALINRGYDVSIYYSSIYPTGELDYSNIGIKMYQYRGDYPTILKNKRSTIITFEASVYIDLVIDNHKNKDDINDIFLYSVHPYTFEYFFKGCKYHLFYTIFHKSFYNFVRESVKNGYVFFMDEQCMNSTGKEYAIEYNEERIADYILRIIFPVENHNSVCSKKRDYFNILTVSRADFPFKGYIKGLIECFEDISHKYRNLKMTIITSGNQVDCIYEWSKGIPNIDIIENVRYENLPRYYKNTNVYIGMGTTILEAASEGVIAIPVSPYTFECKTHGLFSEKPNWVLTEINGGDPVKKKIEEIISLSEKEFDELSRKSKESVKNIYDEKVVLEQFKKITCFENKCKITQYKVLPLGYVNFLKFKKALKGLMKTKR